MTKEQLIEILEDLPDDTEIRLAMQPSWPFEYSIQDEIAIHSGEEELRAWLKDEYEDVLEWAKGLNLKDIPHRLTIGDMDEHEELILEVWDDDNGLITTFKLPDDVPSAPSMVGSIVYLAEERQIGYLPSEIKNKIGW